MATLVQYGAMYPREIEKPAHRATGLGTMYQVVRYWADRTPLAPAIAAAGQLPLSYRALLDRIDGIGRTLNAFGLGRGDRVAIVHPGGAQLAAAIMGVSSYATAVPLNPELTVGEFSIYLQDVGVDAVAVEQGSDNAARAAANRLGIPILEINSDPGKVAGLVALGGDLTGSPRHSGPAEPNDVAVVLATSGTTSSSKLVPLKHRHMIARGEDSAFRFGLTRADRVLNMMSLFHIGGLGAGLHYILFSGAAVIPVPQVDVNTFFKYLSEFQPTFLMGGYTIYHAIHGQTDRFEKIISSTSPHIRIIRSGSGRLEPRIARDLEIVFKAPVIQAYGSSETSFMASEPLPPSVRKMGSVGLTASSEVAILDKHGKRLAPGQCGEVVVRGSMVCDGYENDPAAHAAAFKDGWFHAGDMGYFDADGYLFLTGRLKEMINRGGQKIMPNEVDDALLAHPAVHLAATFPVAHPTLGEEVAAVVILEPGATVTAAALSGFVRERLAVFKVPRQIVFVDAIPKGPTGKIQRHKLAAAFGLDGGATETQRATDKIASDSRMPSALEARLSALWAEVLGVEHVGLDDNFFLLGGDSLQAVELFLSIEQAFGQRLPRSVLFEAGTVSEMARRIEAAAPSSCIVPIQPEGERPPFFCVHDQNGHVLNFRDLARHLGTAQPFYGIQCVGLDGIEVPFTRMDDMAAHYVREIRKIQPTGPYYIGGYSFGGRVAYAMAQQLRAAGECVALLALLDTYCLSGQRNVGAQQWLIRHRGRMAKLRLLEVPAYLTLRVRNAMAQMKISLRARLVPALWRFYEIRNRTVPRFLRQPATANDIIRRADRAHPYDGDAVLFQAQLPALKHSDIHEGWRMLVKGGLEVRPVPGQHFDFLKEPHVGTTAAELSDCLTDRQERYAPQAEILAIAS